MKRTTTAFAFAALSLSLHAVGAEYDVRTFGAAGDGHTVVDARPSGGHPTVGSLIMYTTHVR